MTIPYNDDSLEASESPHAVSDWQRFGMDKAADNALMANGTTIIRKREDGSLEGRVMSKAEVDQLNQQFERMFTEDFQRKGLLDGIRCKKTKGGA